MVDEATTVRYNSVTELLLSMFPECQPAHERLIADWGGDERPGQYIIVEDLLGVFLRGLLVRDPGPTRDALLQRCFDFVELLLGSSGHEVRELGYIGLLEHHPGWWYARALPLIGPRAATVLNERYPDWRKQAQESGPTVPASDRRVSGTWGIDSIVSGLLDGAA